MEENGNKIIKYEKTDGVIENILLEADFYYNKVNKKNRAIYNIYKSVFIKKVILKRYGVLNYKNVEDGKNFILLLQDNNGDFEIRDFGIEVHFIIQTIDDELYYSDYNTFEIGQIKNIYTIFERLHSFKVYKNRDVVFLGNHFGFSILKGCEIEFAPQFRNGPVDYYVYVLNLLEMTTRSEMKNDLKTKTNYLDVSMYRRHSKKSIFLQRNYKIFVENQYSLDVFSLIKFLEKRNIYFSYVDNDIIIDILSGHDSFFELMALLKYLHRFNKISFKKINGVSFNDYYQFYNLLENGLFMSASYLCYSSEMHKTFKLNIDLSYDEIDFCILFTEIRMDKTKIYLSGDDFHFSFDVDKIERMFDKFISLVREDGNFISWQNEYKVYLIAKSFFKDAVYQYRNTFLGMQSLDVFIPSIDIGIEYQGIQHFKKVDFFNNDLNEQKRRDEEKNKKCKENNITLIYWNYDEEVNLKNFIIKFKKLNINLNEKESNLKYIKRIKEKNNKNTKIIACYSLDGDLIKKYSSVKEAGLETGTNCSSISQCINGLISCANNYVWKKYVNVKPKTKITPYTKVENNKKVFAYKSNILIGKYISINECSRELGIDKHTISQIANGKKKRYKDYYFEFNN